MPPASREAARNMIIASLEHHSHWLEILHHHTSMNFIQFNKYIADDLTLSPIMRTCTLDIV